MADELIAEPEVEARTADDLDLRINTYNRLRDEKRGFENRLAGLDHTQRPVVAEQIAAIEDQIHGLTFWISAYYGDVLQPDYRKLQINIVEAKTAVGEAQATLAQAELAVGMAESACYSHWVTMRNAARPAGKPKPPRYDTPSPRVATGQVNTYGPQPRRVGA